MALCSFTVMVRALKENLEINSGYNLADLHIEVH